MKYILFHYYIYKVKKEHYRKYQKKYKKYIVNKNNNQLKKEDKLNYIFMKNELKQEIEELKNKYNQ